MIPAALRRTRNSSLLQLSFSGILGLKSPSKKRRLIDPFLKIVRDTEIFLDSGELASQERRFLTGQFLPTHVTAQEEVSLN